MQNNHQPEGPFSHLVVEFFTEPKFNKRKTAEEGRPIYDDLEKVRIRAAGDPKSVFVAPAHDASSAKDPSGRRLTYAELHEGPYEAFKKGQQYIGSGTPLSELTFLTAAKRKELQDLNIHTAEALAALDGANLSRLGMGGRELKNQAAAWLERATGSADVTRLAAENAALAERLAQLEAMVSERQTQPPVDEKMPATNSPFQDWDDDSIRLWLEEQGASKPHHACKHDKLVQLADEWNEKLRKQSEAA